ncbi:MAG: hypothetical protein KKG47_04870 [Proteobacteria bacterium]|nr:hypothetical protein [Pseudomonadota bacterium]MBU1739192.1 hypothetical protein [Pseudomonadota bacterium]
MNRTKTLSPFGYSLQSPLEGDKSRCLTSSLIGTSRRAAQLSFISTLLVLTALYVGLPGPAWSFERIMVMPVEPVKTELADGAAILDAIITEHFQNTPSVMTISTEQEEALAGELTGNRLQIIKAIADKLGSDAALVVSLHRFRERTGDNYSSDTPTSLAFEYRLIRSADGRLVCSGSYDETQESLLDNVFDLRNAFKRGFKWISAEDMAREALAQKFSSCPDLAVPAAK